MNEKLRKIAITEIESGLTMLNEGCNEMFNRMYPGGTKNLRDDQLINAMDQIDRSLKKPHLLRNPAEADALIQCVSV